MVILVTAASTSILFAAFYRATQLPDYHKRHHVYNDDDGEAVPVEHDDTGERTTRILMALFALAAFILSVWNWTVQQHNAGLVVITIAWVFCQSIYLSTSLTWPVDHNHVGLLLACSAIASETTTLRHWPAYNCFVTNIVTRLGNCHFQGISTSIHILDPGYPWRLPGLHMLFFATATQRISQRHYRRWAVHWFRNLEVSRRFGCQITNQILTVVGTLSHGSVRSWTKHVNLAALNMLTYRRSGMPLGHKN